MIVPLALLWFTGNFTTAGNDSFSRAPRNCGRSSPTRTALGLTAIPAQIGFLSKRSFDAAIRRYDKLAGSAKPSPYTPTKTSFAPSGRARLAALCEKLRAQGVSPEIVKRLAEMLEQADDLTLGRIRSHALADYWGVPRRAVLEACLWATRTGILDLQWDSICPHCRGAKQTSASLSGIRSQVYCDNCNIDFAVNCDQTVELTFRPNSALRIVEAREYCVGGPQVTPHIVAQQLIAPGEQRQLTLPLEAGRYRLRSLELGDAPAFGRVMSHFDVLREVIAEEDGALVKTIGDAVMAVFRRPVAALRAILKAQQALASPPEGVRPLLLKAGIHVGPCIAVTLNDRRRQLDRGDVKRLRRRELRNLASHNEAMTHRERTHHVRPRCRRRCARGFNRGDISGSRASPYFHRDIGPRSHRVPARCPREFPRDSAVARCGSRMRAA